VEKDFREEWISEGKGGNVEKSRRVELKQNEARSQLVDEKEQVVRLFRLLT